MFGDFFEEKPTLPGPDFNHGTIVYFSYPDSARKYLKSIFIIKAEGPFESTRKLEDFFAMTSPSNGTPFQGI